MAGIFTQTVVFGSTITADFACEAATSRA